MAVEKDGNGKVLITGLLKRMWPSPKEQNVTAEEIAIAISHIFTNSLSSVQTGALLTALHFTGLDREPDVLAHCAQAMRSAAAQIDHGKLKDVVKERGRKEGTYQGGLCDIVGTGGDSHNTFNISTTTSVIASSILMIAKHGNRASTSKSGSADMLQSTKPQPPILENVQPATLAKIYSQSNYAFFFAPVFHPGMRWVAPIRKELGWRTIFNLLGPLSNPVDSGNSTSSAAHTDSCLEARVIGVARRDLGPSFAEALRLSGSRKAMVVCGDEELDELSCAGPTHCWRIIETSHRQGQVEYFTLHPSDFGFPCHALSEVEPGKEPTENAASFVKILRGEMPDDHPLIHFVLMNVAALFVVSGVCEADQSSMGAGDDGQVIVERGPGQGRWKEGVRRARWAIKSGAAFAEWEKFVKATYELSL